MKKILNRYLFIISLFFSFLLILCLFCSCSSPYKTKDNKKETVTENNDSNKSQSSKSSDLNNYNSTPTYKDNRWPTNDNELLSIPENQRWYTAGSRVGSNGTIAGPVTKVYQANNSRGRPTFIDIGVAYPSSGGATIVIWDEDMSQCYGLVQDANKPDAWVSVSGYISSYNGTPQITSENRMSWKTWWKDL